MTSYRGRLTAFLEPLFFLAAFITIVVPRLTVAFLIILAVFAIVLALLEGTRARELFRLGAVELSFLAFGLYLFVNASWSADPIRAAGKAAVIVLYVVLTSAGLRAMCRWPKERALKSSRGFMIGVGLGLAYVLVELFTHRSLTLALYNYLPFLQPSSDKGLVREGSTVLKISPYELNRSVNVLLLAIWPAILLIVRQTRSRFGWLLALAFYLISTLAIMISQHNTSQIAVVVGGIVFLVAYFWPRGAWLGIIAVWCLCFAAVLPSSILAYKADLQHASWLPESARARIILWAYTTYHVSGAPILGVGGSSTRKLAARPEAMAEARKEVSEGRIYAWWTGPHAHNIYLQTWYELGAVGVLLLMIAGSCLIWRIGGLPPPSEPYMLAYFITYTTVAASSWGLWETWFLALPGLAMIYGLMALKATMDEDKTTADDEAAVNTRPAQVS